MIDTLPNPDVVLTANSVNGCRNGPADVLQSYPVDVPYPAGRDPMGIEVRFEGNVRLDCHLPSGSGIDEVSMAYLGIPLEDYPVIAWWGCIPP